MPAMEYGNYIVVSMPKHREDLAAWIPFAMVAWLNGRNWEYHELKDLDNIFDAEEEALAFGFAAARAWIDQQR